MPAPSTARQIAAKILAGTRKEKQFAAESLYGRNDIENKPAATDLVMGVLRNSAMIDTIVSKITGQAVNHFQIKLLDIIRVAVYELVYCPQTADYAIVNEAVNYATKISGGKGAGFVNAVLRKIQGHIINRETRLGQPDIRRTVPQTPQAGCEFDIEMLPDRNGSPADYLSVAFSLPGWLVENWLSEYGSEQATEICFASNRRPSVYLRPNPLKTTAQDLSAKLREAGIDCKIEPESQMLKLSRPGAISELPGFNEGLFVAQDLSASGPVRLLNPQQDWNILDLCAAPGTKTTQLAEATAAKAKITATDTDVNRLKLVRENVVRLGVGNCVTVIDYQSLDGIFRKRGGFDCVLVDAPCSNTGVLARRPEVRHRITKKAIEDITKTQEELLSRAGAMLRQGGVLCYSACSIQPGENQLLVKRFLEGNPDFNLKAEKLVLPGAGEFDRDGSYAAVLAGGQKR